MAALFFDKLTAGIVDFAVGVVMILFVVLMVSGMFTSKNNHCDEQDKHEHWESKVISMINGYECVFSP